MKYRIVFGSLIVFSVLKACCLADVRLPAIFGDNMVLQQNSEVAVWGWASVGEEVSLRSGWNLAAAKTVKADKDGKWLTKIETPRAGGPYELTIKGNNTIVLTNVLIGEVWLCSGQSNMEMPLGNVSRPYSGVLDYQREISEANYPGIRLFQVGNTSSNLPLDDVRPGEFLNGIPVSSCKWEICSPESVQHFSAVGYFFIRDIQKKLGVPVGIIDATWGGTTVQIWMGEKSLRRLGYGDKIDALKNAPNDSLKRGGLMALYNGMINPLVPFTMKGVIWYQGEGNVKRAAEYEKLFAGLIDGWRESFGINLSFYYVQIAPFNYKEFQADASILREAQLKTLEVKSTGMVVTADIGDMGNVHPKNKQEVSRRLSLWALAKDYGFSDLVYSGPLYRKMKIEGDKIRISFDFTGSGLMSKDDPLTGFTIAGMDKNFVEAAAVIDGNDVVVSSDKVPAPKAVRFGWADDIDKLNLFNKEDLPASPFRTDNWDHIKEKKL